MEVRREGVSPSARETKHGKKEVAKFVMTYNTETKMQYNKAFDPAVLYTTAVRKGAALVLMRTHCAVAAICANGILELMSFPVPKLNA